MTLYQIIKALQAAPKKGGHKLAILEQHKDNELLQAYLKAVYDPRINYYITKLPKKVIPTGHNFEFDTDTIDGMLYHLAQRVCRGKAAENWLYELLAGHDEAGRELIGYIIKRDICADIGEGTVLKVWPKLFFIPPYQRCSKMDEKVKKRFGAMPYFFVQTKSDGQFSYLINHESKAPESMSRAGSLYPSWLPEKLTTGLPKGYVLAGEMVVHKWYDEAADGHGEWVLLNRQEGNGILNSILSGDGSKFDAETMAVQFVAWDILTIDEFESGISNNPYEARLGKLAHMLETHLTFDVRMVKSWKVKSIAEAMVIQNQHLARKEEGTVWKAPDMGWKDSSSGDPLQVKAKLVFQADFRIDGTFEGEGKYKGMCGGFNMSSSDGKIKFNVGTGFSDAQRKEYYDNPPTGKIATIEGNDILSSEGKDTESIFLPVLIEVREDKMVADSRDEVWAEFNAARGL